MNLQQFTIGQRALPKLEKCNVIYQINGFGISSLLVLRQLVKFFFLLRTLWSDISEIIYEFVIYWESVTLKSNLMLHLLVRSQKLPLSNPWVYLNWNWVGFHRSTVLDKILSALLENCCEQLTNLYLAKSYTRSLVLCFINSHWLCFLSNLLNIISG